MLHGDFLGKAERFAAGALPITLAADIAQTVSRGGRGAAVIEFAGDLYYAKQVFGYGTAIIEIGAVGYVGVKFMEGSVAILPAQAELSLTRAHLGDGIGQIALVAEFAPQATRRTTMIADTIEVSGDLDASHVDQFGQRYISGSGAAPIPFVAVDAGMIRQAFLGSMDISLLGAGSGSLEKPTLAGAAAIDLQMLMAPHVERRGDGSAVLQLAGGAEPDVFVPGDMQAVVRLVMLGTGYVYRRSLAGDVALALAAENDGTSVVAFSGTAETSILADADLRVYRVGHGVADILLFSASDAYLNPAAMDIEEQWFSRPAPVRDFSRPSAQREFLRTP